MTDAPKRKKSNKRKRSRLVAVRLSEEELTHLVEVALLADVSVAEYLRASGLKRPLSTGRKLAGVTHAPADLRRLLAEVNKVGSNLNQIARAANIAANAGEEADTTGLAEALAELEILRAQVRRALGVGP